MTKAGKDLNTSFYIALGKRLILLRRRNGVSLAALADMLGISYQQYQKYEDGRSRLPLDRFVTLKKFYDVSYDSLLGDL